MRKLPPDTEGLPRPGPALQTEPPPDSEAQPDAPTLAALPSARSSDADSQLRTAVASHRVHRDATPLPTIAGYEILGILGRGGMGIVYKARQLKLNRIVALKMVLAGHYATPDHLERFRTEAQAVARLQHPHIVQIYDVGEHEGLPYFSLEYVPDGSLEQKLNDAPLPARRAAHLVEMLARAIHLAHQKGIVHRDLKPSNVLLARCDPLHGVKLDDSVAELAHYEPKISDFGLAKRLDDVQDQTRSGAIIGTPGYMAPEQAGAKKKQIGPATDVYALGAILYELLTGRPPFLAETQFDTLLEILEQEPAPPRLLNAKVDRDVETICLKCLEKNPADRYASALALAEDLRRYRMREPITARSSNILDRLTRTLERSRHDIEFYDYASMLHLFAALIMLVEMVVHSVIRTGGWVTLLPVTRVCQLCLMGLVFWRYRSARPRPPTTSEQQMWAIWMGYVATCAFLGLLNRMINGPSLERELTLYPSFAAVTGLIFFILGSSYWGSCYAFSVAFLALALLMTWRLEFAPLAFGALWSASLVVIGRHLQRLGDQAAERRHVRPVAAQRVKCDRS